MRLQERIRRKVFRKFIRGDDGTVTVEAVLWLPLFIGFFALFVDATMVMFGQAQALRVVQDLNRGISIGLIDYQNENEVRDFIGRQLPGLIDLVDVPRPIVEQGVISTELVIPSRLLAASGALNAFTNFDLRVTAHHLAEF